MNMNSDQHVTKELSKEQRTIFWALWFIALLAILVSAANVVTHYLNC